MSRCAMCDYCRETDGGNRLVRWSEDHKEFMCNVCRAKVFDLWTDLRRLDKEPTIGNGDLPLLEFEVEDAEALFVEGLGLLPEQNLGED